MQSLLIFSFVMIGRCDYYGFICNDIEPFTPLEQYVYSPYCSPYISQGADKENLLNNQELT